MNLNGIAANMTGLSGEVIAFLGIFIVLVLVMIILAYIFESLAIYRIMKNRNLNNAFLAWVPIACYYAIGKVYDDINEKQGKKTNFSIILLILGAISCLPSSLYMPASASGIFSILLMYTVLVLILICFKLIFKTYAPNNSSYFILTVIFSFIPIIPFIPGLCLLKVSKNKPVIWNKRLSW